MSDAFTQWLWVALEAHTVYMLREGHCTACGITSYKPFTAKTGDEK